MKKGFIGLLMILSIILVIFAVSISAQTPKTTGNLLVQTIDATTNKQIKANLFVDELPKGKTPKAGLVTGLCAGTHNVRVTYPDYCDNATGVSINSRKTTKLKLGKVPASGVCGVDTVPVPKCDEPTPTPTKQGTSTKCTDTDRGKRYYIKGTTCSGSYCETDFCCDTTTGYCIKADITNVALPSLAEFFCNKNVVTSVVYECQKKGCSNGACIK